MAKEIITNWDKLPVCLDLHTVALIYNVTDVTIKKWLKNGKITGKKIGDRKWIFDREYIRQTVTVN